MKIAVYAGSFDPPTLGHLDIIKRAGEQYDRVIIAIATNPAKKGMFTPGDRGRMLCQSLDENEVNYVWPDGDFVNGSPQYRYTVTILPPKTMVARWAADKGASALVRGLRATMDFESEFQMALTNRRQVPEIETVFFMTSQEYLFTSSSMVKELVSLGEDVTPYVSPIVAQALRTKVTA